MKNVMVDKDKRLVKLSFNNKFYNQTFIDRAIQDFSKVCDIKKEEGLICIQPKEEAGVDLETIGYEFYNYVLALIKNN